MKKLLRILLIVISIPVALVIVFCILFFNPLRTLHTLKKLDDYGMYSMTYYGDYWLDEYLEQGGENGTPLSEFLPKKLTKGIKVLENLAMPSGYQCSTFVAHNEKGEVLFGRNFDYRYAPSVVLKTSPKNGYSSICVADAAFAGYTDKESLPEKALSIDSFSMLATPYLSEDGMNEKGVAISIMSVPYSNPPRVEGAPYLSACGIVRMVLDKAASTDEAVELLRQVNFTLYEYDMCHFMIADRSGKFVVVEFHDKEMYVVETTKSYHISTNFYLYNDREVGNGQDRYEEIERTLIEHNGILTEQQALELLNRVSKKGRTQWSAVYNLTTGDVSVYPCTQIDHLQRFQMEVSE